MIGWGFFGRGRKSGGGGGGEEGLKEVEGEMSNCLIGDLVSRTQSMNCSCSGEVEGREWHRERRKEGMKESK